MINEEIRDAEVRVIDETGTMLGVLPIEEALSIAEEKNLDLVNVSPNANPPVCKILDYGKYRYEIQKREKDAKKRQKVTEVKEVRLSTFIEEHDIQVKAKNASKFLQEGNRVKVSLRLRGRERDYANHAIEVMNDFAESLSDRQDSHLLHGSRSGLRRKLHSTGYARRFRRHRKGGSFG